MEILPPRDDVQPESERDRESAPRRRRAPLDPEAAPPREARASEWELPPRRSRPRDARPEEPVVTEAEAEMPPLERIADAPLHESWRHLDAVAARRRRTQRPVTPERDGLVQSIHLEVGTIAIERVPRPKQQPVDPRPSSSNPLLASICFDSAVVRPRPEASVDRPAEIERLREARAARRRELDDQREKERLTELARHELEPLEHGSPWPWVVLSLITGGGVVASFASMSAEQITALIAASSLTTLVAMYYFLPAIIVSHFED